MYIDIYLPSPTQIDEIYMRVYTHTHTHTHTHTNAPAHPDRRCIYTYTYLCIYIYIPDRQNQGAACLKHIYRQLIYMSPNTNKQTRTNPHKHTQIDEIKALRDTNKLKESKFQEEQQELMRMEAHIYIYIYIYIYICHISHCIYVYI